MSPFLSFPLRQVSVRRKSSREATIPIVAERRKKSNADFVFSEQKSAFFGRFPALQAAHGGVIEPDQRIIAFPIHNSRLRQAGYLLNQADLRR